MYLECSCKIIWWHSTLENGGEGEVEDDTQLPGLWEWLNSDATSHTWF